MQETQQVSLILSYKVPRHMSADLDIHKKPEVLNSHAANLAACRTGLAGDIVMLNDQVHVLSMPQESCLLCLQSDGVHINECLIALSSKSCLNTTPDTDSHCRGNKCSIVILLPGQHDLCFCSDCTKHLVEAAAAAPSPPFPSGRPLFSLSSDALQ